MERAVVDVERLRKALVSGRRQAGWSQEELAERSGVSVRTIRNFEAGVIAQPRLASVRLLLEVLDVTQQEVLGPPRPAGRPGRPPATTSGPDRLFGRDHELARLTEVGPRSRILVLTGPGGVGKTRLATEYASRAAGIYRQGLVAVPLGALPPTASSHDVMACIRSTLAATPAGCDTAAERGTRRLVMLDNAEHLLLATAEVVTALVADMPRLDVLVTSRRPLPCAQAYHWDVKPLPYELTDSAGAALPAAVELFLCRAEASCPTLDLSGRVLAVSELCARLDGIPFALELAAARIRSVSLEAMLRTEPIARLLDSTSADGLPHQRNLVASVRWSYDLLTDQQRGVLHQLSQFAGRFTLEEAEGGPLREADSVEMVGALSGLVDASLVTVSRCGQYQYRVIGFVRELVTVFCAGLAT